MTQSTLINLTSIGDTDETQLKVGSVEMLATSLHVIDDSTLENNLNNLTEGDIIPLSDFQILIDFEVIHHNYDMQHRSQSLLHLMQMIMNMNASKNGRIITYRKQSLKIKIKMTRKIYLETDRF